MRSEPVGRYVNDVGAPSAATGQAALSRTLTVAIAALFAAGVPFVLFRQLILFHFYTRGAFPYDTGLIASLIWHNGPWLHLPDQLGGISFFVQHVSPVLLLFTAASAWLPFSLPEWFALYVGLCHALLATAIFWLLAGGYRMHRGWRLGIATLTSIAFACSGLALDIARFPHFETLAAAFLLLFFTGFAMDRPIVAAVCLVVALATREDIGLHAFGFLTVWLAFNWRAGVPWRRSLPIIGCAVLGLLWSAAALSWQRLALPESASFAHIYLGDPPLAHITPALLTERLGAWLFLHPSIILPALLALTWSVRRHDPFLMAGYIACVPWTILHFCAASRLAGLMVGYYGFPFLIAMVWPWLAPLLRNGNRPGSSPEAVTSTAAMFRLLTVIGVGLVPIGGTYDPGRLPLPEAFLRGPSAAERHLTDATLRVVADSRATFGRLIVDSSVAALLPRAFTRDELSGLAEGPADTVVFFTDGFDAARLRAMPGLSIHAHVPGTPIEILTNRRLADLRRSGIVTETPDAAGGR